MRHNKQQALLAGFAALLAVPALAQTPARATDDAKDDSGSTQYLQSLSYRDYLRGDNLRASELIGAQVHDRDGKSLAEIKELVIASGTDMIVLSVGGVLNLGNKLVAVPYEDLRVSSNGETLYVNRTRQQLEAAPAFTYEKNTAQPQPQRSAVAPAERATDEQSASRAAAGRTETEIQREIDEGQREIQRETNEAQRAIQRAANEAQRDVPPQTVARAVPKNVTALGNGDYRGSEIIGAPVLDSTGEKVAEVDDLVVSTHDKKIHAVLSVGGVAGIGSKLISIPFDELKISPIAEDRDGVSLRVETTAEQLESKPVFRYQRQVALEHAPGPGA